MENQNNIIIYDKYNCKQNIDRVKYYTNNEFNSQIDALSVGYHLNKETQQKSGGVFFFNIDKNNGKIIPLENNEILLNYGILDIKILKNNNLITANSDYSYSYFKLDEDKKFCVTKTSLISDESKFSITNDIIELDKNETMVISGANDGNIFINDINKNKNICEFKNAHDYGIWSLHLLQSNENILLSGGEDAKIKLWDLRIGDKSVLTIENKSINDKSYQSSINYIDELKFDLSNNTLITGSYDEKIILFDIRKFPNELKFIKTDHSSWDMRQYNLKANNLIFIASIYEGFNIWKIDLNNNYNMEHLLRLPLTKEKDIYHKSIVYGLDIKPNSNFVDILSCSFYDNLIMHWKFNY